MNIVKKDENISQTVPFVPAAGSTVALFTFAVPDKSILRFKKFGNYIDTVAAWGVITWRILKNGIGVPPYGAILDQLGTSALPEEIQPGEFLGGDVLTVEVTNAHIANVDIGIRVVYEIEERG